MGTFIYFFISIYCCLTLNYSNTHFVVFLQSQAHENQPCSKLQAYGIAHKGKAKADITFNVDDPPKAYSNPTIQSRITRYVMTTREVRGPDFDPVTQPLEEGRR
jgi:hypothetical protein